MGITNLPTYGRRCVGLHLRERNITCKEIDVHDVLEIATGCFQTGCPLTNSHVINSGASRSTSFANASRSHVMFD